MWQDVYKLVYVDLTVRYFTIDIGSKTHSDCAPVSVFELKVNNCNITIGLETSFTFSKLPTVSSRLKTQFFKRLRLKSPNKVGLPSYSFDNCTFSKALDVDIQRFVELEIIESFIKAMELMLV